VYSVSQLPFRRPLSNEFLHDLQFLVATGLESAGIVKYVAVMIGEHKFILDVVLAPLSKDQEQPTRSTSDTNINGRVKSNLGGSKTGLAKLQRLDCVPPHPPGKQLDCP
jgi:hypothetical protein